MTVEPTDFQGLYVLTPRVFTDERGYFFEAFNARTFLSLGFDVSFVQDNQSYSTRGVLRGMHYQNAPYAQTKLVRVLSGVIWDVALDLRRDHPTFGKYFGVELSSENKKQLLVPKGFAHGFITLSDEAEVLYKCDVHHQPDVEGGIIFDDPAINIDWRLPQEEFIISAKDQRNLQLVDAKFSF